MYHFYDYPKGKVSHIMKLNTTLCALLVIGMLAGCGAEQGPVQVTQTRTVSSPPIPGPPQPAPPPQSHSFGWKAPEGWTQTSPKPMRLVNFQLGPETARAECYISVLQGMGGGVEMNVNRWRGQVGQEPLSPEAIAELPTIPVAGGTGPLIEAATPEDGGAQPLMLLGTMCAREGQGVFVKMIGPKETVLAERERFLEFCRSIQ
ncbi:MAG: hypothetical protein GWP08_12160 [Nitrospiraceae bacterium]|nr:hypothetical protein [Nitrospiraceae bacterium]